MTPTERDSYEDSKLKLLAVLLTACLLLLGIVAAVFLWAMQTNILPPMREKFEDSEQGATNEN